MGLSRVQEKYVARDLLGTTKTGIELAEQFGVAVEEIERGAGDQGVQRCKGCRWWIEAKRLKPNPEGDGLYCQKCR